MVHSRLSYSLGTTQWEAISEQICNLRRLFLCFEAVLGVKINLSKSEIILVGELADVDLLANIFGCRVARLPMNYLGLPLRAPYKSTSIWSDIVQKWRGAWLVGRGCIC